MSDTAARVHPIPDEGLGNTSYVVEVARGLAVSVDPPRDPAAHLAIAERAGARIAAVLETHLHADFLSGSRELAAVAGAVIHAPAGAVLAFGHSPVADGDEIAAGDLTFQAVATPGHTPEHLAYVLARDGVPLAVFSGGSLIAGGAARTDLIADDLTEELARAQIASARRIAAVGDGAALHPTHGGGSFCSVGGAGARPSTIGDERRSNPLLRTQDPEEAVRALLEGYGSFPPYFLRLRDINRGGAPLLRDLDEPRPMSAGEVAAAVARGAWLIDGRPVDEWAARHARGAVSIAVRPQFASWLGWVVPFGAPVVLVADEPSGAEAIRQARGIGYDRVLGRLDGGTDAWEAAGFEVASVARVPADQAAAMAAEGAVLLDVRQPAEWRRERIPGAVHIELGDVIAGKAPERAPVIAFCGHGERSATAASLLERRGLAVANLAGGLGAWKEAGQPVER